MKTLHLKIHQLIHWEYWPFEVLYLPMYLFWLYYSLRSRSFFFFNASNPSIQNGGFLMESKKEVYRLIPEQFYPATLPVSENSSFDELKIRLVRSGFHYPLIAKPDIGMRGLAVQKLENDADLKQYLAKVNFDFLIQEFIDLPNEMGIFFVRYPNELKGRITGIVRKKFLIIEGDGQSTIEHLLQQNPRFHLQLPALINQYGDKLLSVPAKGERINLVPYGNHARGALFLNFSNKINEKLTSVINEICLQVPDFYYGRLDIKYRTLCELEEGKNFSVIELNGAGSEPTHIYDPRQSLVGAWKEIVRHFKMLFQISRMNHQKGHRFLSFKEGIQMLRQNQLHVQKLKRF